MTHAETWRWSAIVTARPSSPHRCPRPCSTRFWGGAADGRTRAWHWGPRPLQRPPARLGAGTGSARPVSRVPRRLRADPRFRRAFSVCTRGRRGRSSRDRVRGSSPSRLEPSAPGQERQQKCGLGLHPHSSHPWANRSEASLWRCHRCCGGYFGVTEGLRYSAGSATCIGASPLWVCSNVCDSHAAARPRRRTRSWLATDCEGSLGAEGSADVAAALGREDVRQGPLKPWSAIKSEWSTPTCNRTRRELAAAIDPSRPQPKARSFPIQWTRFKCTSEPALPHLIQCQCRRSPLRVCRHPDRSLA